MSSSGTAQDRDLPTWKTNPHSNNRTLWRAVLAVVVLESQNIRLDTIIGSFLDLAALSLGHTSVSGSPPSQATTDNNTPISHTH